MDMGEMNAHLPPPTPGAGIAYNPNGMWKEAAKGKILFIIKEVSIETVSHRTMSEYGGGSDTPKSNAE